MRWTVAMSHIASVNDVRIEREMRAIMQGWMYSAVRAVLDVPRLRYHGTNCIGPLHVCSDGFHRQWHCIHIASLITPVATNHKPRTHTQYAPPLRPPPLLPHYTTTSTPPPLLLHHHRRRRRRCHNHHRHHRHRHHHHHHLPLPPPPLDLFTPPCDTTPRRSAGRVVSCCIYAERR